MTVPWGKPPPASFEFGLADLVGVLAFFIVGGLHTDWPTSFGERDAVRCSLILLDGPQAGKEFQDVLIFNQRPVSRLRSIPGAVILSRIALVQGRGANPAVEMMEATPEDDALGLRYVSAFPNKLAEFRETVMYSYRVNEAKAAQGDGAVRSEPHPTHAGTRTPANNFGRPQAQPAQQPVQPPPPVPPWGNQPQQPPQPAPVVQPPAWANQAPPAPAAELAPMKASPTLDSMRGVPDDPWNVSTPVSHTPPF